MEQRLREALKKASYAEAELEFVRKEHENERSVVQQLLADVGTLQAQLDSLQTNSTIEVGLTLSCALYSAACVKRLFMFGGVCKAAMMFLAISLFQSAVRVAA